MNLNLITKYQKEVKIENYADLVEESLINCRQISLGDIDEEASSAVETMIRYWNTEDDEENIPIADRKPITIYIDSGGGSIISAFTIIDSIKISKTPVHTVVVGAAYSAGLEIAISGHVRSAFPNASFLFHEGSMGTKSVDANKFKNLAEFYKELIKRSKQLILEHTLINEEWYKEHAKDDVWFFADEALRMGCIDKIVPYRE